MKKQNSRLTTILGPSIVLFLGICAAIVVMGIARESESSKGPGIDVTFAKDGNGLFSGDSISQTRQWRIFWLTNDSMKNAVAFREAKNYLAYIKESEDTMHGVEFVLDSTVTYQSFIRAIDICNRKAPKIFVPFNNVIWAFYSPEENWRGLKKKFRNSEQMRCIRL